MKVEKRYEEIPSHSGTRCVVWYHERLGKWPLTLLEIEEAAKTEFSRIPHHKIILQRYECGIIMRVEYEKLKQACSE